MPLSEASLVQCNTNSQTGKHPKLELTSRASCDAEHMFMPARVQLIFPRHWIQLDRSSSGPSGRELSHEIRCGRQIHLERGQWRGLSATLVDWAAPHAPAHMVASSHRDPSGLAISLAAAVESSPDAKHWLLLLHPMPSPFSTEELEQRIQTLEGNTMVTWRSAAHDLLAAGFSCELYSELIRLDSTHALDRLLRRYPCLQVVEPSLPFLAQEHSPTVHR